MIIGRDALSVAFLALTVTKATANNWYPANFATPGGEEICTNDGNHPVWIEEQGLLMANINSCCNKYFGYMNELACIADSSGVAYTGSGQYYPKYLESKCVQDCGSGGTCGGVVTDTSTPLFGSIQDCCATVFGHIDLDLCVELSVPTGGTNKFFADTSRSRCLKDCEPSSGVGCTRVTNPSAKLYSTLSTCCSEGLPWSSQDFCNTRSIDETSNKWFASEDHLCRQDCASGATCANLTDSTKVVYDTALECCQAELTFVDEDTCNTLSLGNPLTGSSQWYVSYETGNERCFQDCPEGSGNCGGLAALDTQLFSNATSCCQTKLPHKRLDYCEAISSGNSWAGSGEYYPDFASSKCLQDCDESTPGCGGIVTDASKRLFTSSAECCNQTLPTIDAALCEDRSNAAGTGTGKYFAEPGSPVCVQDTGLNRVTNPVTRLYDDASSCCSEAIPWVTRDFCTSRSAGLYSDKWYVADYSTQSCVKDCAAGGASCVPVINSSTDLYDTSSECCTEKLSWADSAVCEANSNGTPLAPTYTNKFYVSYADNKCLKDCPDTDPAPCGGNPSSDKTLYDDLETCCTEKLSWLNVDICVADSNGVTPTGSNLYYVDWTLLKCVQDCEGNAPCGGFKTPYDETYSTTDDCCARLSWINSTECVLA